MSIFNEPISKILVTQLNRKQDLMGKENRNNYELTFLNSNSSWVKLQSSVNITGYDEAAQRNVLLGGSLAYKPKEGESPERWDVRQGVATGDNSFNQGNAYTSYIPSGSVSSDKKNPSTSDHMLGLRPMPGITSLRVESIGAYGSVRKATVNFQCWDIKQLEVLEALYMRPGYTVLLEFGRNFYLDSASKELIKTQPKTDFFSSKVLDLQTYLSKLYTSTLNQGGHYDAFFGYVVNYKWAYRIDGGYDCMTEIISTGEVAESIKLNHSLAGTVKYTAFGIKDLSKAKTAAFKGLFLEKANSGKTLEDTDIVRLNNEYAENILSGLIYEIYTAIRYTDPGDPKKVSTGLIQIPKRYQSPGDTHIQVDWGKLSYKSTDDPAQPTEENPAFLTANDNYYITLNSFCKLITEYNLPYSYDGNFKTSFGNLTAISTNSRFYTKETKTSDPLLCLYNNLMISTNPDVCWINTDEWIKVVGNATVGTKVITTPPAAVVATYNNRYVNSNYSTDLQNKINQWINDIFYDRASFKTSAPKVLQDIYDTRKRLLGSNNFLVTEKDFAEAVQANFQVIRGGIDSTGFRDWRGLKVTDSKLALRDYLRKDYQPDSNTFWNLINGPINLRIGFLPLAFSSDQKQIFNTLETYGKLDTKLDAEIQKTAPVIEKVNDAEETKTTTVENLTKIGEVIQKNNDRFKKEFIYDKEGKIGTSKSKFGNIGHIYINLKYAYKLAKDPGLLSSDQAGKNTLSLGKYFDTFIQNIQTSLGNVNNFKIHIDPIDGVARIIDLNYTNINASPELFKFEIGSTKTIVRDLKLESQVFSNQMSMIAISAQAEPGKLAYDNTSLTSYNEGITDRNIVAKNSAYPTKINDGTFTLNFISNLGFLVNKYLKNLYGLEVTKTGYRGGTAETSDAASGEFKEYEPNFNANNANSYSNALRDIIAYSTSNYLMDNANKAILPTQISLTIDGMSGFVIGNLFKVDENFIPKFYKNSARNMGYTITGLNHEILDNDWTTTIQGYPVDLSSNSVVTTNPTDFSSITFIDEGGNIQTTTNNDCGNPTEKIFPFLSNRNKKKIGYNAGMEDPRLSPIFYDDFVKVIIPFFEQNADFTYVTSATGKRPLNPTSAHVTGNAVDIQINGINKAALNNSWTGKKYTSWNDFRAGVNSAQNYSAEYNTSSPNRNHPYNQNQIDSIMKIHNGLISKFQGTKARGAFYYDLTINGRAYRLLNEYLHPVPYSEGPHFHIMRLCGSLAPKAPVSPDQSTSNRPSPTPNNNRPAPTPLPTTPTTTPIPQSTTQNLTTALQTAITNPPTESPIIVPVALPVTTPTTPTTPPTPPIVTPTVTTTVTPTVEILPAPSKKSTWKFPYYVQVKYIADGSRTNINDEMHAFQSTKGKTVGNGNVIVGDVLKKMYKDGIKPKVTGVKVATEHKEKSVGMHWTITIEESTDGLAYTGFTSRGSADVKYVSRSQALSDGKDPQSIINNINKQLGYTPQKFVEVADIVEAEGQYQPPRYFRQIFYAYTDQNPEGIKSE